MVEGEGNSGGREFKTPHSLENIGDHVVELAQQGNFPRRDLFGFVSQYARKYEFDLFERRWREAVGANKTYVDSIRSLFSRYSREEVESEARFNTLDFPIENEIRHIGRQHVRAIVKSHILDYTGDDEEGEVDSKI